MLQEQNTNFLSTASKTKTLRRRLLERENKKLYYIPGYKEAKRVNAQTYPLTPLFQRIIIWVERSTIKKARSGPAQGQDLIMKIYYKQ